MVEIPRPFLKWAGGKAQLIPEILKRIPEEFSAYHEPFLGGGAVFFALFRQGILDNKPVYLSDNNPELINAFRVVRDEAEQLLKKLAKLRNKNNSHDYYRIRDQRPRSPVNRAARLIYLNRTCYNGLYRVNSRGRFNVPFGRYKNPRIYDPENILAVSRALQEVNIHLEDFEKVLERASAGDFVYFDPPYYPVSETANFSSYTSSGFSQKDHERLAEVFEALVEKGVFVMESNSDTEFTRQTYRRWHLHRVLAKRAINSNPSGRGAIAELIITSYPTGG